MQKPRALSMKGLDQMKSLQRSLSGSAKALSVASPSPAVSVASGTSFTSLKQTAEKLVKEQASVRSDLDSANSKLNSSTEYVYALVERLQTAVNENAKFQAKQKEDEKLWQALDLKFSSAKTLVDQLTGTLQVLGCQVQDAEKHKQSIEEKLSANSVAFKRLNEQMKHLSLKLESSEETVRDRDKALEELETEIEKRDAIHRDYQGKTAAVIQEKDAFVKSLEADLEANRLATESLKCNLDGASAELESKEEELSDLKTSLANLEKGNADLHSSKQELANRLDISTEEIKSLKDTVNAFAVEVSGLEEQSLVVSDRIAKLCSLYDSCCKLAELEKDLCSKRAKNLYGELHHQYFLITSEKKDLESVNQKLDEKVVELQRDQGSIMVQHADECRLAEEKFRKLESELDAILSKRNEAEKMVISLEEKVVALSEKSQSSENEVKDLILKLSALESENQEHVQRLKGEMHKKEEDMAVLQNEIVKYQEQVADLEKQLIKLGSSMEEKEQLIVQYTDRAKQLEEGKTEIQSLLAASESKLEEAKKQYDAMLESKQTELSRHLKEISQRNDQAINDIRKKYAVEKQEMMNLEKEKADAIVMEMEKKCEARLVQCKEETDKQLARVQEEHSALICSIKEEHKKKESSLDDEHCQELRRIRLEAENEIREKVMALKDEHEIQVRAMKLQHEDACRKLQEELDLQKAKEERQRALLQLQMKVMADKPREDQEANSRKEYSVSSMRRRNPVDSRHNYMHASQKSPAVEEGRSNLGAPSPVSALLTKMGKGNSEKMMDVSKNNSKVTHCEFEVERGNVETVGKRRKTRGTVMSVDPRKHKRRGDNPNTMPIKSKKSVVLSQPPNHIGDLFLEGSLNPYTDDPYAFG